MARTQGYRNSLVRQMNEQAVIDTLFSEGPLSRVEVAERTGLSKPTVSAVVRDLVGAGLVHENGRTTGMVGRSAILYRVDAQAGHVIGIDLGGTKVRAAVADLFGEILAEQVEPTAAEGGEAVLDQLIHLTKRLTDQAGTDLTSVQAVVLGSPGVFDPKSDQLALVPNIPGFEDLHLSRRLREQFDAEVLIENDVNLAAVGERWRGVAARIDHFAFLAIGTGIGMGLVINGELHRGLHGAAGEVAYLPIGADPFDPAVRRRGALEEAASASGILARLHDRGGQAASVRDVFAAAERGDALARELVDEQGRLLALAILSTAAVVDPELVVLGGGIGSSPLLLPPVRAHLDALVPYPVRVESSALGDRAALLGALTLGLHAARKQLFPGQERSR